MVSKYLSKILKTYSTRKHSSSGFTLAELLVAMVVGVAAAGGIMFIAVNILETDKRESAKTKVQQDMAQAMDYLTTELQEAVYVYEDIDLVTAEVSFPADVVPILAFWKLENLPYNDSDESLAGTDLPESCKDVFADEAAQRNCYIVKTKQNSYTLVVYSLRENDTAPWKGPAQLERYQLREYQPNALSTLTETGCYGEAPTAPNFSAWTSSGAACPYNNATAGIALTTLVDLVDENDPDLAALTVGNNCPNDDTYTLIDDPNINSFYACVSEPQTTGDEGGLQNVVVNLRGNGMGIANLPDGTERTSAYLPTLQRRVKTRSAFERKPPTLN